MSDDKDYNYDRITSAKAMMGMVEDDMLRIIYRGNASSNIRNRMVEFLRIAAEEVEKIKVATS